jgi:23S rRNA pseudouridine1911/1915/1917 synthase
MLEKHVFITKLEDENKRIDVFLHEKLENVSRTQIKGLIDNGSVKINMGTVSAYSELLEKKVKVTVSFDAEKKLSPNYKRKKGRKIHVLYEDRDIIVVEKDSGILSVPTKKKETDTVIHQLNEYIKKKFHKDSSFVYIVHRLDQATSGILVFARSEAMQDVIKKQFRKHGIHRKYVAIVEGILETKKGKIESYLDLDDEEDYYVRSTTDTEKGHLAITHYIVRKEIIEKYSVIDVTLETGKRNQIRVHFAEMGHPLMGDEKYSRKKSNLYFMPRLALHAIELGFKHPRTDKMMHFKSTMPRAFDDFVYKVEAEAKGIELPEQIEKPKKKYRRK